MRPARLRTEDSQLIVQVETEGADWGDGGGSCWGPRGHRGVRCPHSRCPPSAWSHHGNGRPMVPLKAQNKSNLAILVYHVSFLTIGLPLSR